MEMPKPSEAHRRFETMAGDWLGDEIMHPSPFDPAGGVAIGHTISEVGLDGFALIGEYQQERDGVVTFRGHSVWTYDGKDQCYVMYWWDSMGSPVNVFKGNYSGDILTMNCSDQSGHWRLTYDYSTPGTLKSIMQMSQDGQNFNPLFEGTYYPVIEAPAKKAPAKNAAKKPAKPAKPAKKKPTKPAKKKPSKPVKKKKR
jgi:hypothetical protein